MSLNNLGHRNLHSYMMINNQGITNIYYTFHLLTTAIQ